MSKHIIIAVMAMFWLFFASYVKSSEGAESADSRNSGAVSKQLDSYREGGTLATNFLCDGGSVSVFRYSTTSYTLLTINNDNTKNALFVFSNTQEALAGGSIDYVRQYFKRFAGDSDAAKIDEKEFISLFEEVSPNFYRFVAKSQHALPSDKNQNSVFENDCRAVKVSE